MGEEAIKILYSGNAAKIIGSLLRYRLLAPIMPGVESALRSDGRVSTDMKQSLERLDEYVIETGDKTLGVLLAFLVRTAVEAAAEQPAEDAQMAYGNALEAARQFLAPLTMPRVEVETAVRAVFKAPEPRQKVKRPRRRRRRKPAAGAGGIEAGAGE